MQRKSNPKIGLLVGAALSASITMPISANAVDMSDIVSNIYGSFTSTSGTVNSTNDGRLAFMGGAASLRFNPRQIRAVNFSAPSASVSCGGIDFFAGSLDIMSKDDLIAAGRNIAAGATVYAFRLALNSVCSSCMSIMTSIQNIMDRINELANATCEDTVKVLSSHVNPDDALSFPTNAVMEQVSNGFTNVEEMIGAGDAAEGGSWVEWLSNSGSNVEELKTNNPKFAELQSDIGFNIAFNTEAAMFILPWLLSSGDFLLGSPSNNLVAKSALWNLLSETVECANDTDEKALRCGVKDRDKLDWTIYDLVHGASRPSTTGFRDKFHYQTCNAKMYHNGAQMPGSVSESSLNASSRAVCKYDTDTQIPSSTFIHALAPNIYKEFYGVNSLTTNTASPEVPDPQLICESDNTLKTNPANANSAFNKLFTGGSFNGEQRFIVQLMGAKFTHDLYKLNGDGKYITNVNENGIGCMEAFEATYKRMREVVKMLENGTLPGFERAIKAIKNDPRLSSQVKPGYIAKLRELQESTAKQFQTNLITSSQIESSAGGGN
ncbi:hypothetical protein UA32_12680 [Photobacterium angustum]|uniref:Conjugal transfer protein TraH n=1 Tax=Photobacterium angustum TaxID=661 RepID=A0ABX5H1H3_PHOAN|nr:conjugal transfer protein TraH [Photobacterium angustum]KJG37799.1 hypothetical protein UA32_12680 [Photobacterium angustum]PSX07071.1 hypothetical protein C0W27_16000 [Photobacterium angustum]